MNALLAAGLLLIAFLTVLGILSVVVSPSTSNGQALYLTVVGCLMVFIECASGVVLLG